VSDLDVTQSEGDALSLPHIIVFAKAPLPGLSKTRLIPALGEQGAAILARRMLDHSLAKAIAAKLGPVELCASPFGHEIWSHIDIPSSVTLSDQGEGDLGVRMARACSRILLTGKPVLLIGTDCPALDANYLRAMGQALQTHHAVIAAATDGGYPAIGLSRFDPSVFEDIAWSTSSVLRETLVRFQKLNWQFQVFPALHDIDEPKDLIHVPAALLAGLLAGLLADVKPFDKGI
jgi:uncharacterized protein